MNFPNRLKKGLGYFLLTLAAVIIAWLLWPFQNQVHEIVFNPGEIIFNLEDMQQIGDDINGKLYFNNPIQIILEGDRFIRKGEDGVINFELNQRKILE